MEALNAVLVKPVSVLKPEPKKHSSFPTIHHLKISKPQFHGSGLVLISSVFNSAFAKALTYEEALNQSTTASDSSFSAPDLDISGVLDGIINFGTENPLVVAGGAAAIALPIILSQVLGKSKPWGVASARIAYEKLGDDENAQLLDIRAPSEIRAGGSPDIRGLKKKAIRVAYNGDDKPGFLKKLALKLKEPENTTLFILDKFDGSSELVAELVSVNGFKSAYAIKDGAEGPRGWANSSLPWILPQKSFAFDLSSVTDAFDGFFEGSEAISVIFGVAVATGLGLLAFTEVETILEVLGSAALVQLVTKKLLYAEDRKRTLKEVEEFLTAKIGPKDILNDIKDIGIALLPLPVSGKSLPATTTVGQEAVVESTNPPPPPPPEIQPAAEPISAAPESTPAAVNSIPKLQVKEEAVPKPKPPRALSPYPYYPNFKPPTSPTPSRP